MFRIFVLLYQSIITCIHLFYMLFIHYYLFIYYLYILLIIYIHTLFIYFIFIYLYVYLFIYNIFHICIGIRYLYAQREYNENRILYDLIL